MGKQKITLAAKVSNRIATQQMLKALSSRHDKGFTSGIAGGPCSGSHWKMSK